MAQNLTVSALAGVTLAARDDRLVNEALTEGLLAYSEEFKVKQQASPNMTVRVGSGVAGDRYVVPVSGRGTYIVHNRTDTYIGSGNSDVPISNGHATNPRIDGIDLQVQDNEYDSSGQNRGRVIVTAGTPAGSPTAPAVPSGCVRLATILVPANESTSIDTGDITDLRPASNVWSTPRGDIAYAQVTTTQSGITALTDITSLTCTFTAPGGRRYLVHFSARVEVGGGAGTPDLFITDGSNVVQNRRATTIASGQSATLDVFARVAPSAGSVTYKARASVAGGASASVLGAADLKPFIHITDIGGYAPKDA